MPKQEGWIADRFKAGHHKFRIGDDIWLLSEGPITEATYDDFSRAVYECKHERDGEVAIVKIWMQTEREEPDDANSPKSDLDGVVLPPWEEELQCLEILRQRYDDLKTKEEVPTNPFPDAIGFSKVEQEMNFPVPGGYLADLVTQKLPGVCIQPTVFWGLNWDKLKRDKFRRVFMESLRFIAKLGIVNQDRAMRNLLYHEYKDDNGEEKQKWFV